LACSNFVTPNSDSVSRCQRHRGAGIPTFGQAFRACFALINAVTEKPDR
jgi:hypothetical protein